jgi:hypothetical protein
MNATTTTPAFTHTITGRASLRYVQHHHRGPKQNRTHAINNAGLVIREMVQVETVCGGSVRMEHIEEIYGEPMNCGVASERSRITCKDCRKKLGI